MKITFGGTEDMSEFWGMVKMILSGTSNWVLIWVAITGVGLLLGIVVKAWRQAEKDNEDEDIEFRNY